MRKDWNNKERLFIQAYGGNPDSYRHGPSNQPPFARRWPELGTHDEIQHYFDQWHPEPSPAEKLAARRRLEQMQHFKEKRAKRNTRILCEVKAKDAWI